MTIQVICKITNQHFEDDQHLQFKSFCYIFRSFTCPSCMEPVDAALLGKISSLERQSINPRSDSHYMSLLDPDPGGTNFKQQVEKCMEIVNSLNFNTN